MISFRFVFSTMGAGKSLDLIKRAFSYKERNLPIMIFNSKLDNRFGENVVASRVGVKFDSLSFTSKTNFTSIIKKEFKKNGLKHIFIDEAQFLKKKQVKDLLNLSIDLNLSITCYGLKSDFKGELFEGSKYLFVYANQLEELDCICNCGEKATINARIDESGNVIKKGKKILIGGNESYVAVCAKCYFKKCKI